MLLLLRRQTHFQEVQETMRRQFKKVPRKGKSTDDLYRLDRYERMKREWIEAHPVFTVQEYEAFVREAARVCRI